MCVVTKWLDGVECEQGFCAPDDVDDAAAGGDGGGGDGEPSAQ